jgi:hypothetical protein
MNRRKYCKIETSTFHGRQVNDRGAAGKGLSWQDYNHLVIANSNAIVHL